MRPSPNSHTVSEIGGKKVFLDDDMMVFPLGLHLNWREKTSYLTEHLSARRTPLPHPGFILVHPSRSCLFLTINKKLPETWWGLGPSWQNQHLGVASVCFWIPHTVHRAGIWKVLKGTWSHPDPLALSPSACSLQVDSFTKEKSIIFFKFA